MEAAHDPAYFFSLVVIQVGKLALVAYHLAFKKWL